MKRIHQLIGGAGTGKTTRNMDAIAEFLASGVDPMEVLFSSFTKVARQTAAVRAESITGYSATELVRDGWFRTLQSVCYRQLEVRSNQMLTDNKASRDWLSNLFDVNFEKHSMETEDGYVVESESDNLVSSVLNEWTVARMSLVTADDERRWPVRSADRDQAVKIIERYEQQKYQDGKLDFADLALQFCGIRHEIHGLAYYEPRCAVPPVVACIFDEYQDTPELLHRVAMRIVESPTVTDAIISGDPFQSVFGFIGADPQWMMSGFPFTSSEIMRQSHRCARAILELGEKTIRQCTDYFDRNIKPNGDDGHLIHHTARQLNPQWLPDPTEDWLVVGRTNHSVNRVTKWLSDNDVPWIASDNGSAGYVGPRKRRVGETLFRIRNGQPINGNEWAYAIEDIPTSHSGVQLLMRGVKVAAKSSSWHCPPNMLPKDLLTNGATEHLVKLICESDWNAFDPAFQRFLRVATRYGSDLATSPKIRASTIHGAKGDEADRVLLYTQQSGMVRSSQSSRLKQNEEHRVWYVGATRARDVLTLFKFNGDKPGYF